MTLSRHKRFLSRTRIVHMKRNATGNQICAKTVLRRLSNARVCSLHPYVDVPFIVRRKFAGLDFAAAHRRYLLGDSELS